jgi:hypothetical protein
MVTTEIEMLGVIWLACMAGSACAMVLTLTCPRLFRWSLTMAFTAMMVSSTAFTGWTPIGRFSNLAYTWSNDSFQFSIRLGSLYLPPLVLAVPGLVLLCGKGRLAKEAK